MNRTLLNNNVLAKAVRVNSFLQRSVCLKNYLIVLKVFEVTLRI